MYLGQSQSVQDVGGYRVGIWIQNQIFVFYHCAIRQKVCQHDYKKNLQTDLPEIFLEGLSPGIPTGFTKYCTGMARGQP